MRYYQDNHITIYNSDCRAMTEMPDESVQCVVTSPPYWGLRKYSGEQELIWGGDETWKGAYGLEPTPEMYIEHTIEILREIRRVLRKDGVVFWNIGDSYASGKGTCFNPGGGKGSFSGHGDRKDAGAYPLDRGNVGKLREVGLKPKDLCLIPFRVAIAAQEDGWWVRSDIIWSKQNPMPESVTDRPTSSHEHILMLTKSARYYWDASAVRERTDFAGATDSTPLGGSTITEELSPALLADDGAFNLQGRCYLSESQVTIIGSVTGDTDNLKVIKAISLTVIGEQSERQFVMDLQPSSGTTSLALITSTLKGLSANNTPVRATIVNATTSPSGAIDPNPMLAIPSTDTSPTTEAVLQAFTMLAGIAEEGLPTLVTIHSDELESPLLIRGTLRPTHIDHNTINTNVSQGRNIRSVWELPTQPYPEAHFAVFPEKLPEICIKAASKPDDIILDPFAGAGTTLWVAKKLNRRAVGYEISQEYCQLAVDRCRQQVLM